MQSKRIAATAVIAAMMLTPAGRGAADGGDFAIGVLTGVIGSAVVRDVQKKNQAKRNTQSSSGASKSTKQSTSVSSAQREQNRAVQTALNYFSFPVGTPDGALGPRSRAAIGEYQATLSYPATGQLSDFERDFLLNSYYRAQAGGAATNQAIAANPQGVRGLLIAYRNELAAGGAPAVVPNTVQPNAAVPDAVAPAVTPDAAPQGQLAKSPDASVPAAATELVSDPVQTVPTPQVQPAAVPGALPSFLGADAVKVSLGPHCEAIAAKTALNGTVTVAATMTDPGLALSEQFCAARGSVMDESEAMAAKVPGFTPQQVSQQCAAFGPILKDYVTALGQQPEAQVLERVSGFTLASGMATAQLAGTARVCLGLGYAADDMNVALGSALVLSALGETAYAELVAYQLSQGFGVAARPDLAIDWYDAALAAPVPAFADAGPDRMAVIRSAVDKIAGRVVDAAPAEVVPASLPTFGAPTAPAADAAPAIAAEAAPAIAAEVAPAIAADVAPAPAATHVTAPTTAPAPAAAIVPKTVSP